LAVITWDIIFTNFGIILSREDSKNKAQDQESVRSSTTPSLPFQHLKIVGFGQGWISSLTRIPPDAHALR
jgi:hypothetical protein